MVLAQYRLLSEKLGVNHLRLVMGTSMGAMHTWVWGETYPDFMDALMPLASNPVQIGGRNRVIRKMITDSIENDPEWKNGEYTKQPNGLVGALYGLMLMTSTPLQWQKQFPTREAADEYLDDRIRSLMASTDANDMLYQFEASRDYDPSPALESIKAPLLAINSADDFVNPPELGVMEREIKRVKRGRFVLIPISDQTRGHGTHSIPAIWKNYLAELLKEASH
jgi:homoserine O-acetyltransferase/O-succinyltransferase